MQLYRDNLLDTSMPAQKVARYERAVIEIRDRLLADQIQRGETADPNQLQLFEVVDANRKSENDGTSFR